MLLGKLMATLRNFIPPIFLQLYKKLSAAETKNGFADNEIWRGNYISWAEAESQSVGYDSDVILSKTLDAIMKVKNGEAVYERDSVIFEKPQYSWPLIASLLRAAVENSSQLNILDFGGSLGSSYFQNRKFLSSLKSIKWSVVEQPHFVLRGNDGIADEELKFYYTIEACIRNRGPSTLLLSGVLQYLKDPYDWLKLFRDKSFKYIILDRTAFVDHFDDFLTVQHVPETIYKASYPAWFLNKAKLIQFMSDKYELIADFNNGFTPDMRVNGKEVYWNGMCLKQRGRND